MSGRSREDLASDLQLQDAIIRRLSLIGEAAKRVFEPTCDRLTTIPWSVINGMRNRLVHEYDGIDLDVVWDTALKSLPTLILELKKVIPSL
ncbi:HepT-like ribonuclease domain-containing protein [Oscillatoria sp. HE19RPO]|uniref:HepT-like ribonuclease domain-containing protein n=1 Tax=Oscillatoria sp. HE19RPO TaxID=2954806 RepID=UPI0028115D64|nr:HepT-like ribonuclease domain-containing protein [Oscillatoria sp. HE19RPO]